MRQCPLLEQRSRLAGLTIGSRLLIADNVSLCWSLQDDLGDRLVAAGVNLVSYWGLTETGAVLNSKRDFTKDKGWNWLRCEGLAAQYVVAEPRGGDTYELVVLDGYPPKIMSNRDDGSYATKDLFVRHPTERTWYKYIGRLDDTLTQTLGEKTNPVPIELAIVSS